MLWQEPSAASAGSPDRRSSSPVWHETNGAEVVAAACSILAMPAMAFLPWATATNPAYQVSTTPGGGMVLLFLLFLVPPALARLGDRVRRPLRYSLLLLVGLAVLGILANSVEGLSSARAYDYTIDTEPSLAFVVSGLMGFIVGLCGAGSLLGWALDTGKLDRPAAWSWERRKPIGAVVGVLAVAALGWNAVLSPFLADYGRTPPPSAHPSVASMSPYRSSGQMPAPRYGHSATLLADGRVLIAGGADAASDFGLLYDTKSHTFAATPPFTPGRHYLHSALLLKDGRVLIGSGYDWGEAMSVFEPGGGAFEELSRMTMSRASPDLALLPDGQVLVVGGGFPDRVAEIYDPATGRSQATSSTVTGRGAGTRATVLRDGRVLITGGTRDGQAELYDPGTGSFVATGSMLQPRYRHFAALLPDGRVLIAGGIPWVDGAWSVGATTLAEIYDPATGRFSAVSPTHIARDGICGVTLRDGRVLIAGGLDTSVELFDPRTSSFLLVPGAAYSHSEGTATLLKDGRVLLAGGAMLSGGQGKGGTELFDPSKVP